MEIFRIFRFEAAHRLPHVPPGHKCGRVHGHSYTVEVRVRGALDPKLGWVTDFADLAAAFAPVDEALDHRLLNDVEGLSNPTCENLAVWIWDRLAPAVPLLAEICVRETPSTGCVYRGELSAPTASAARTPRRRSTRARRPTRRG